MEAVFDVFLINIYAFVLIGSSKSSWNSFGNVGSAMQQTIKQIATTFG